MKPTSWWRACFILPLLRTAGGGEAPADPAVRTLVLDWLDDTRGRTVPAKVYFAPAATGACPVVIFSHGLGGTREGASYLGDCWASNGYVAVFLQHTGSDESVWRGKSRPMQAMRAAASDPAEVLNRPRDVAFALDRLAAMNTETNSPLRGRLDLGRVGVSGHSFGAYTALAAAGRVMKGPLGSTSVDLHDPRIRACIALSPPARGTPAERDSYAAFAVPCLHVTGTEDRSPINDTTPEQRRIPYDAISASHQFLVIFKGADHMVFSGRSAPGRDRAADERTRDLVARASLQFWNAFLRDDPKARAWLCEGEFKTALGDFATLETKSLVDSTSVRH